MPLLETALIVKGGLALAKFLTAKGVTAKTVVVASKAATTQFGMAATVGAVSTVCLTTGLLLWAKDRAVDLRQLTVHLRGGDFGEAGLVAARLMRNIGSADGMVSYQDLLDNFLAAGGTDPQASLRLLKGTGELLEAIRT